MVIVVENVVYEVCLYIEVNCSCEKHEYISYQDHQLWIIENIMFFSDAKATSLRERKDSEFKT